MTKNTDITKLKKHKKISKAIAIGGGVLLTVVGFKAVPLLLTKCSNSLYKKYIENEDINFDDMKPEIIKKKDTEDDYSDL